MQHKTITATQVVRKFKGSHSDLPSIFILRVILWK